MTYTTADSVMTITKENFELYFIIFKYKIHLFIVLLTINYKIF